MLFVCSCWLIIIYTAFAYIYNFTINMMKTLLRLFRGKKYNVMRERDDANNYSVAELYLGVLIITLSIFLLPTVAIFYYYVFISIILNILALQLVLIITQTFVTEFPYFMIPLTVFRPYTLPNSIRIDMDASSKGIRIVTLPLGVGPIFENLFSKLKMLVDKNTFSNIFISVITGKNLFGIMRKFLQILSSVKPED